MRIIIGAGKTKREIVGEYALCASEIDFITLKQAIEKFIDRGASYGWVEVREHSVMSDLPVNSLPLPWE